MVYSFSIINRQHARKNMDKIILTLLLLLLSLSSFGKSVYFMNLFNPGEISVAIKTTELDNSNILFEYCDIEILKVFKEMKANRSTPPTTNRKQCSLNNTPEREQPNKELRDRDSIGYGDIECQVIGSEQGYSKQQLAIIDDKLSREARNDYIEDGAILGISFAGLFWGSNKINNLFKFKPNAKKVAELNRRLAKVEKESATTLGSKISKTRRKIRLEDDIDYEVRRKQPGGITFRYGWPSVFVVGTYYKATIMDADTRERAGMVRAVMNNGKKIDIVKLLSQDVQELNNFLNDALNMDVE